MQPASSWAEGIRQGSPDYGDIDHAFYKTYEDFRGGIGTRYAKAREDVDVCWSNGTARTWTGKGGIQLGVYTTQVTIGAIVPSYYYRDFPMQEAVVGGKNYLWMAAGNTMMRWDNTGGVWVDDSPSPKPTANDSYSLYEWTNQAGVTHLYWAPGFTNTSTFAISDPFFYRRAQATAVGTAGAWAAHASEKAHDFIEFDRKLLKTYFGTVKATTDGVTWVDLNINIPATPSQFTALRDKFVGLALAPDSAFHPYLIRAGKLYVIDIFTQQYAEVKTGLPIVVDGCVFQDEIAVTDNGSIKLIHPFRPIRDIGLPTLKNGFIADGTSLRPAFLKLKSYGPYLLAYVNLADFPTTTENSQLWLFNGSGWHEVTSRQALSLTNVCNGGNGMASYRGDSVLVMGKEFWIAGANTEGGTLQTYRIPTAGYIENDVLMYTGSPGYLITPWFDGGFSDMVGTAIEMTIASAQLDSTELIVVQYQVDNDESAWLSAALGTNGAGAGVFTVSPQETIKFGTATAGSGEGLAFKTIRFRFFLDKASGVSALTPVLIAATFKYIKKVKTRNRYRVVIDARLTANELRGGATADSVIDEIYNMIDDNPLTPFSYTLEPLKWVTIVTAPRQDGLSPEHTDKYSSITLDLLEPVGV